MPPVAACVRYSPAVEAAIASVCPPRDAFDAPDFDPVEYLNSRFPDEASLAALPAFLEETGNRLRQTENDLLKEVERQAGIHGGAAAAPQRQQQQQNPRGAVARPGAPQTASVESDLQGTQQAVAQLFTRVEEIRSRAAQTEESVKDLVSHIRELDTAKTNLTQSINTLRSVQLWMLQLQVLSSSFERKRYLQCHDALREAQKYSTLFEPQKELPKIKELNDKQQQICRQIEYYVRNTVFGDVSLEAINEAVMAEACSIVDLMGEESIKKLRDRFIEKVLESYFLRFKRGTDDAKLERTERRYVFIRTLLDNYKSVFQNVFPRHWCVAQELCVTFCLRTKQELDYQLSAESSEGQIKVVVLMYVLQKTLEIERDLTHQLAFKEEFPGRKELPTYRYNGLILAAFKAHMYLYINNEDKLMADALAQPLTGQGDTACPGWNPAPAAGAGGGSASAPGGGEEDIRNGTTLPIAEDMFVFIRESLKRTVRIAQQDILLDMAAVWRRHLVQFASAAGALLPTPAVTPLELRRACILINTAELCQTTGRKLGEEVCARAEVPAREVGFDEVEDVFAELYSRAVQAVVSGTERALAPALTEYQNGGCLARRGGGGPGDDDDGLQDECPLIRTMSTTLHDTFLQCAAVLAPPTLRFLLDKLAAGLIPLYTNSLYRLRRLPDDAVGGLRVDSAALEKTFLQLPNYNDPARFPPAALTAYMRLVRAEFDVLNRALKVLQVPRGETFIDVYYELVLPEDRSIQNFVRLVELKGMRREEVRPWIARLSKRGVVEATRRDLQREASAGLATGAAGGGGGGLTGGTGGGGINFAALFSRDSNTAVQPGTPGAAAPSTGFSLSGLIGGHNNNNNNTNSSNNVNAGAASPPPSSPREGESTLSSKFANVATTMGFLNKFKKSEPRQ